MSITLDGTTGINQANVTGASIMPVGTTAQRPASPAAGMYRLNSTTGEPEWYDSENSQWVAFNSSATYDVEYLIIGGGGAGGNYGGGGAGGYRCSVSGETSGRGSSAESPLPINKGKIYTVIVGAGGSFDGQSGGDSAFGGVISLGGGTGGSNGGSGGGASNWPATKAFGASGQGYDGGDGSQSGAPFRGGGGGGAGSAGANGTSNSGTPGAGGGNGIASSITGSSLTRAGGGGGGTFDGGGTTHAVSSGGSGGGGGGGRWGGAQIAAGDGNQFTGSGGGAGGGAWYVTTEGMVTGQGGSGIVIIRYAGAQRGTGGTVTSAGGFTIHTFTSSGTYTA